LESRQEVVRMLEGYLEQLEQGMPPQPEEWLAQYPGLGEPLEEYLATLELLHQTALNLRSESLAEETPVPQEPALGQLGDYRLLREVGRGGMGIVYEAEQLSLDRQVALKVLPLAGALDRRQLQRFHNEALMASQLHHPHIVDVFGAGCENSVHYYAMRYIEGQTLAQLIARMRRASGLDPGGGPEGEPRPLPAPSSEAGPVSRPTAEDSTQSPAFFRAATEIGAQVAEALDYAHEHGVVHRDIKPSNVILDAQGQAWVTDFGLARLQRQAHLTQSGDLLGTLRYMSPEQALAKRDILDHRTDIYALGATLWELLTLRPAVPGDDRQEVLRRIAFEEPARPRLLNRAIPPDLEAIVLKALAKDPAERYATAQELADDLRRFLSEQPVQARRPSRLQQVGKWARRHRRPLLWAGALALVMLILAVVLLAIGNARIRQALTERDAAERDKTMQLAQSRWNEARALRRSRQPGQRLRSLEALAEAVHLLKSLDRLERSKLELRNEAINCLSLWDVREVLRQPLPVSAQVQFDSACRHYAYNDEPGTLTIRRAADGEVVRRLHWKGGGCAFLQFGPDDRFLTALCHDDADAEDAVCRVWDVPAGRLVLERKTCRHPAEPVIGPDGRRLALPQKDGSIALYDLIEQRDLRSLPSSPTPLRLRFHPSGKYLAVTSRAHQDVEVWDLTAGKIIHRLTDGPYRGASLAWSPDGSLLAIGSTDLSIYVCTCPGGKVQGVLRGHEHVIIGIEFHPSGRLLASTSHDDTTRLWRLTGGEELILSGDLLLRFSRDGQRLATRSYHPNVATWEVTNPGDCLHYLPYGQGPSRGPWGVAFAPDGRLLASASQDGVHLWDAATARRVGGLPSADGYALAFHPKEYCLFTTGSGGVMQWPILPDPGGRTLRVGPGTVVRATTADSQSLRIDVAGKGEVLLLGAGDGGVDLVPLAEPGKTRRLGTHEGLWGVALSPDGRWAASTGGPENKNTVCVWDVARGTLVRRLPQGRDNWCGATFSPDGRWLIIGVRSEFGFWEVGSWNRKTHLPRDPRSLLSLVAFTREGELLALAQGRNRIGLHDAATLRHLATLETSGPASLSGLSLSPDGTRLAATTDHNLIALWNLRRLRQELAALDLDWEMPPYPPAGRDTEPGEALRVEILPGAGDAH
jgi:serine/threonine protein kinase/WD40 repeat protein